MGQTVATTSDTVLVSKLSPIAKQQLLEDAMHQSLECLTGGHGSLRKFIYSQISESMKEGYVSTRIDGVEIPYAAYARLLLRAGSAMIDNIRSTFGSSEEYQTLLTESIGRKGVFEDRTELDLYFRHEAITILEHTVGVALNSEPKGVQLAIALFIKAFKIPVNIDGFMGRIVDKSCL